jgi:hypothetical protein
MARRHIMGGQRIDDHKSWVGKGSKGSVFPMGVKTKEASSAEGAGELARYEDTSEAIKAQQKLGVAKMKAHPQKALHRN